VLSILVNGILVLVPVQKSINGFVLFFFSIKTPSLLVYDFWSLYITPKPPPECQAKLLSVLDISNIEVPTETR